VLDEYLLLFLLFSTNKLIGFLLWNKCNIVFMNVYYWRLESHINRSSQCNYCITIWHAAWYDIGSMLLFSYLS
jgi:hypothetical protein